MGLLKTFKVTIRFESGKTVNTSINTTSSFEAERLIKLQYPSAKGVSVSG